MNHEKLPHQSGGEGAFVTVARVARTQGRVGEVAAALLTDFPERFAVRRRLFALGAKGTRRELLLEDHWFHKGQVVLKFAGVDSISQAEELIGCEIQVPESERAELEADTFYVSDLTGCTVDDSGREIGKIEDIQFGSGEAPLLVVRGAKEYLVPFASEYLVELDLKARRISMKLPPGMLELDAPLSQEEKQRQKQKD
ncbi:MAG TPA: ribosome maturation factor RimM [Candidatus Limnocylindrales bacterium]|nr:ribosome maturation factor RimM [Candidatus Limnocylindrales bacterium]